AASSSLPSAAGGSPPAPGFPFSSRHSLENQAADDSRQKLAYPPITGFINAQVRPPSTVLTSATPSQQAERCCPQQSAAACGPQFIHSMDCAIAFPVPYLTANSNQCNNPVIAPVTS
ncbi:MAG TPA: hypothetical protein VI688_06335, partial [Anaerolineales bacterium]|nr:hypothetical protein [Anaerolineales bacterium]